MIKFNSAKVIGRSSPLFVCGSGSRGKEAEAEAVDQLAASTSLVQRQTSHNKTIYTAEAKSAYIQKDDTT